MLRREYLNRPCSVEWHSADLDLFLAATAQVHGHTRLELLYRELDRQAVPAALAIAEALRAERPEDPEVLQALAPYVTTRGSVRMVNRFRYVAAMPAAHGEHGKGEEQM